MALNEINKIELGKKILCSKDAKNTVKLVSFMKCCPASLII